MAKTNAAKPSAKSVTKTTAKTATVPKKSILKKTDPSKKTAMKKTTQVKQMKDAKKLVLKKPKEKKSKKKQDNIALEPENQGDFDEVLKTLSNEDCKPGTLYIGHIPHGFYEQQMKEYFTQFGTVLKVRLARSKKSGGYKGYGFIQFASDEVAVIAAEAMDGYLMFDKLLQCKVMSSQAQHRGIWKGSNKKFVYQNRAKRDIKLQQRERTEEQKQKVIKRVIGKDAKRENKLKSLGIDYEFPSAKSQLLDSNQNATVENSEKEKKTVSDEKKTTPAEKSVNISADIVDETSKEIESKKRKRTDEGC